LKEFPHTTLTVNLQVELEVETKAARVQVRGTDQRIATVDDDQFGVIERAVLRVDLNTELE
jgi:hypothetical protein